MEVATLPGVQVPRSVRRGSHVSSSVHAAGRATTARPSEGKAPCLLPVPTRRQRLPPASARGPGFQLSEKGKAWMTQGDRGQRKPFPGVQ